MIDLIIQLGRHAQILVLDLEVCRHVSANVPIWSGRRQDVGGYVWLRRA